MVALSSSAITPALLHKTSIPSANCCLTLSAAARTELKSMRSQSIDVTAACGNSSLMIFKAASDRSDLRLQCFNHAVVPKVHDIGPAVKHYHMSSFLSHSSCSYEPVEAPQERKWHLCLDMAILCPRKEIPGSASASGHKDHFPLHAGQGAFKRWIVNTFLLRWLRISAAHSFGHGERRDLYVPSTFVNANVRI